MIIDSTNLFSDQQAITATAVSTNAIDLGVARQVGAGTAIPLLVQVNEDFSDLTSLTVAVQTDSDEAFGTAKTLTEQNIALADLSAGKQFDFKVIPTGTDRYIRMNYTVTGTAPTTGKITAGVTMGNREGW